MIRFKNKSDTFRAESVNGKYWKLQIRCSMCCSRALTKEEMLEFKEVLEKAIGVAK